MQTDSILKLDKELSRGQANRLSHQPEAVTKATRRLFMKWFNKLPTRLGIAGGGSNTMRRSPFGSVYAASLDILLCGMGAHPLPAPSNARELASVAVMSFQTSRAYLSRETGSATNEHATTGAAVFTPDDVAGRMFRTLSGTAASGSEGRRREERGQR